VIGMLLCGIHATSKNDFPDERPALAKLLEMKAAAAEIIEGTYYSAAESLLILHCCAGTDFIRAPRLPSRHR